MKTKMLTKFAALLAGLSVLAGAFAAAEPQRSQAFDAVAIMDRIQARNPSLQSFQAPVHVDVRMRTFPWLAPKLDGTAYYKRPDNYEVVFNRVPPYAHGINKLFGDIGDPAAWRRDYDVAFAGVQTAGGRTALALRLTKKIHSDQLADTIAYVDPSTYQVVRLDFHYTNGGTISMTQDYRDQGQYNVIVAQHADIHIPHVSAVADATFGAYQANVAISDEVFTKK